MVTRNHSVRALAVALLLTMSATTPQVSAKEQAMPTGAELVARYVAAIGGAEAWAKLTSVRSTGTFEVKAQGLPLPDLLYLMARGDTPKVPLRRSSTEMHGRLATALLPFLFALVSVGIAFQLSPRARRLTGFLLSFLPILLVHLPLTVAGRSLSDAGRVPAALGMWAPDAVLLVAGVVLLLRAYRR